MASRHQVYQSSMLTASIIISLLSMHMSYVQYTRVEEVIQYSCQGARPWNVTWIIILIVLINVVYGCRVYLMARLWVALSGSSVVLVTSIDAQQRQSSWWWLWSRWCIQTESIDVPRSTRAVFICHKPMREDEPSILLLSSPS